jgi:hypothetical protein
MDWRNPFEDIRDKLSPHNVKAYQLFLIRKGFIPLAGDSLGTYASSDKNPKTSIACCCQYWVEVEYEPELKRKPKYIIF